MHLEQSVLPAVPIRHWICSLPWGLRALLGYDRRLCAEVVSAFVGELGRSLRLRAKAALGLGTVADAHTGAVAAVQRTDGALRLNVHFHVLSLDGVSIHDKPTGRLEFHALPTPTRAEVAAAAARTAGRIEKILRAHGCSLDPEMQRGGAARAVPRRAGPRRLLRRRRSRRLRLRGASRAGAAPPRGLTRADGRRGRRG